MRQLASYLYLSILAPLSACGGGGGGSTGPGGSNPGGGGPGPTSCQAGSICMGGSVFEPTSITIAPNGTVAFRNESGVQHSVTFPGSSPVGGDIPLHSSGTNTRQFTSAGSYNFFCTVHGTATSGMRGSVTVQ